MNKFLLLCIFSFSLTSFSAPDLVKVESVSFEGPDRVWVCLESEGSVAKCYLTDFNPAIKPGTFYYLKTQTSKNGKLDRLFFKTLSSIDKESVALQVFEVKEKKTKDNSTSLDTSDKSYLEQHDPRTDYMIF